VIVEVELMVEIETKVLPNWFGCKNRVFYQDEINSK